MRLPRLWVGLALVAGLAACGEKPQDIQAHQGKPAYLGTGVVPFTAQGWKAGDQTSWEETMRQRTQSGQNEYSRSGGG